MPGRFTPWGVPVFDWDRDDFIEGLKNSYRSAARGDTNVAVRLLLERNEQIVSRCALLVAFSGILMAIFTFVGTRYELLPQAWEQFTFYMGLIVWVFVTAWLLLDLFHWMPRPVAFGNEQHLDLIARLYTSRLWRYNVSLAATIVIFLIIVGMLLPLHVYYSDVMFHPPPKINR